MKRKILALITSFFGVSGIVLAAVPFVASMNISERALANRPHIPIDEFEIGDYALVTPEGSYSMTFLVYRSRKDEMHIWKIPTHKGKVILPDIRWGRWAMLCSDFALDKDSDVFRCMDEELQQYSWVTDEMRWDLDGKNLGVFTEDMIRAKGVFHSKYFVVGINPK